jgi:hypothetical protein
MDACFDCAEAFLFTCYVARAAGPVAQSPCSAAFRAERRVMPTISDEALASALEGGPNA